MMVAKGLGGSLRVGVADIEELESPGDDMQDQDHTRGRPASI